MSTQVSTSHTLHTRAPLKVPKRPPMNHVAKAIQKFLPIVVAFLLSMVIYSYIRPSTTVYPPYYPPNVGEESSDRYGELGEFARNTINKRTEIFEQIKRKTEDAKSKTGEWQAWNGKKTSEIKQKLEDAKAQGAKVIDKASEVVNDLQKKSGASVKDTANAFKSMGEDVLDHTIDAADWWKEHGEQLVDDAKDFSSAAQEFAYDAIYAWKQKAAEMKAATKSKLEGLKDSSEDAIQSGKRKAEHAFEDLKEKGETIEQGTKQVKETASEILSTASEKVHKTLEKSVDELGNRLEGLKEGLLRAAFDNNKTPKQSKLLLVPQRLDNNTMASKLSSFIERVKAGLVHDEEVRRALSMKAEWEKVDFEHKVNGIVQQVCLLGDDVVEEVLKRLEEEHTQGTCCSQPVCPA